MNSERVYLDIGYDRYRQQQGAMTKRLGAYGSILSGVTNAMSSLANGGSLPSRVGFIEGQWLVLQTDRQQFGFDLSSADLRFGLLPVMLRTGGGANSSSSLVPAGKRPALAVRPAGADEWFSYPLHDVMGVVLPGRQLHALANAITAGRSPADPATDVVAALRNLADDPFAQHQ